MKRLTTILILLVSITSFGQGLLPQSKYSPINGPGFIYKRHIQDSVSAIPLSTSPHVPYRAGGIRYNILCECVELWNGTEWKKDLRAIQLTDSSFQIGDSVITIRNTGGGGGSADSTVFSTNYRRDTAIANVRDELAGKQPAGNYITGLTGPVTATGPGSAATSITNNAITDAMIRQSAGLSVLGRGANVSGNVADITAASDHQVLRRNGSSLGFGAINLASPNAVTGNLPITNLNITGTPDGTKYLRGDGTWTTPPGGSGTTLYSDLGPLSETKIYSPAVGVASSSNVTNYSHTSVDSARYMISTTRAGTGGSEYGAWLFSGTSGDSIKVTAPFWVVIGDSQAEGHTTPTSKHGRLHWLSSGVAQNSFKYDYPDSAGQLSYHLRFLTNMRWYNHGIGGETTVSIRRRFYRDALGVDVGADIGGRGQRTLSRKPQGVVITAGINDIFNGVPAQVTKDNLEWMASVCQQEGIRCVILNIPGDAISTQTNLQDIASMNKWFESGVMDQYGACVVDYNSWWNDTKRDNIHHTALIADDVHPSAVGYDSLANYIYRQARLPKLIKAVFINELDPGGFTGYSRPVGITINSDAYTISSANDTIPINSYVPDSVWIKVISSTNITGTTYCGFSHIEWYTTNNPLDTPYYTKRTLYSGSQKSSVNIGKLAMIAPTPESGYAAIDVTINDMTSKALQLKTSGAGGQLIVNGLTNTSPISSAALSVYKNTGYAIATDGNILTQGSSSQIGNIQITQNATASTTGYGISANNTASTMRFQTTAASNKDAFRFDSWSGSNVAIGSTKTNLIALTNIGFGNASSVNQTANAVYINPTYNQTTTGNSNLAINGITYSPIITSLGNARHRGLFILSGNNYLNAVSDSTCIGCDSNSAIGANFRANGSIRFDLGSDATGDMYYRNSSGLFTRLGVGSDGDVLTLASGLPSWAAPSGGGSYTFSNGLTESGGAVKLGGALTENTTISSSNASYKINITGVNTGQPGMLNASTSGNGGVGITGTATGTSAYGLHGVATGTGGRAIMASATDGTGVYSSATGVAFHGESTSGKGIEVTSTFGATNSLSIVNSYAVQSASTVANGFGGINDFYAEMSNGSNDTAARITWEWTNATAGSQTGALKFWTKNNGGNIANRFQISGDGKLIASSYGAGAHTGTVTNFLAVASDGSVIETSTAIGSIAVVNDADHTVTSTESAIRYHNNITGARTVTIPDPSAATNREIWIKWNTINGGSSLNITTTSGTALIYLDGTASSSTYNITASFQSALLKSDGTSWYKVN